MSPRCFLAAGLGLLGAATPAVAFQLRSTQAFQDEARDVVDDAAPQGDGKPFCAGIFTDWTDKCGSVRLQAPAGDYCSVKSTCGGCGGYWCTSQCTTWEIGPDHTAAHALVEEKVSTVQDVASHGPVTADTDTKFCCLASDNPADPCGSCQTDAVVAVGGFCANRNTCGSCGGSWCRPVCTHYEYAVDPTAAAPLHVPQPVDADTA